MPDQSQPQPQPNGDSGSPAADTGSPPPTPAATGTSKTAPGDSKTAAPSLPNTSTWHKTLPIQQIYKQIQKLFGNDPTSLFQMEFPCRLLDRGTYDYKGSDTINAQQIKPPAVGEAEFRLADDLYSLANLVGGPNGSKLSSQYEEIIFSLIPTSDGSQTQADSELNLKNDQDRICAWLEEKVPNFDPPTTDMLSGIPPDLGLRISKPPQRYLQTRSQDFQARTDTATNPMIPRVDLYQKLVDTYESEKARWVQYKADARPRDDPKQSELDAYDRLLQTYAPVVDAKLEALWTLLVVRGQYHRVRTYVGYVDVESASEALQQAKENLRACVSRSIDDSENIYPVIFSPANWAAYLSTDFQPTDLLADPSSMLQALFDDEKALALLQAKQSELLGNSQFVAKANLNLQSARAAFDDAYASFSSGLSDSVLSLVKIYFNMVTSNLAADADPIAAIKALATSPSGINQLLTEKAQPILQASTWSQLCTAQQTCMTRQNQLNVAQSNYARAQAEAAEASAADNKTQLYTINNQIISKQMDIKYYQSVLKLVKNPTGQPVSIPGAPDSTGKPQSTSIPATLAAPTPTSLQVPKVLGGASTWQTITVKFKASSDDTTDMIKVNVSDSTSTSGCLFWSSSSTTTTVTENGDDISNTSNTDIQVGFNIMKVEIERPWMNAGLFGQSSQFYRNVDTPIARYDPLTVSSALHSFQSFQETNDSSSSPSSSGPALLPSFPTSFIVAKDVHIVYTSEKGFSESTLHAVHGSTSSSGGFLCFQSSSTAEDPGVHIEKTSVSSNSHAISIKIPAPQILGWISELVPKDCAQSQYTALPADEFVDTAAATTTTSTPAVPAAA